MTDKKPNILFIMADDIGITNISAYSHGIMGYRTPNLDRIAKEGALLTDFYGENSCTAGRSAFITGQSPLRTGLSRVGLPATDYGLSAQDVTLAQVLKTQGYACGQFGKNHLGDLNKFLPTVHGFDEFFGILYHWNTYQIMENRDYPKDNEDFQNKYGPRNLLHTYATEVDDDTIEGRWGRVGKQRIEDAGDMPLERQPGFDDEIVEHTCRWIREQTQTENPWFCWFNTSRMHYWTRILSERLGGSGQDQYNDVMVDHDRQVGQVLNLLDELGVADNTIIVYTSDNGPHLNEWPDSGMMPFRGEKNTNWEGAFRVPCLVRWPGVIEPGSVIDSIMSMTDWFPTFAAAAGVPDIKEKLHQITDVGGTSFKVHLDGYNFYEFFTDNAKYTSPRKEFIYAGDEGQILGVRYGDWKAVFAQQDAHAFDVWRNPFRVQRVIKLFNLRRDPWERADIDSNNYNHWQQEHEFIYLPAFDVTRQFLDTFKDFPPHQVPLGFDPDAYFDEIKRKAIKEKVEENPGNYDNVFAPGGGS